MPTITNPNAVEERILRLIRRHPMKAVDIAGNLRGHDGIEDEQVRHAIRDLIRRREAFPDLEWRITPTQNDHS